MKLEQVSTGHMHFFIDADDPKGEYALLHDKVRHTWLKLDGDALRQVTPTDEMRTAARAVDITES